MFWLRLLSLLTLLCCCCALRNLNVTRTIDTKGSVVRIEHEITVDDASSGYEFAVHPSELQHLAHIGASIGKNGETLSVVPVTGRRDTYVVDLKRSPGPISFTVITVFINVLDPKPAEILQNDKQFVKYTGNVIFYSPYATGHQLSRLLLPVGELLRYTSVPEPITKQSKTLTYGPYFDMEPNTHLPLHVHFESNRPFLTVTRMTRHIEISHWGNIAVEEMLEIQNMGAKLRGPFSRLDFDMGQGQQSAVVHYKTALPVAAKDIYYRDEIGNISTSAVSELLDTVEVRLQPRFPLMGGWKTNYILGYNVPAHEFLYRSGSKFSLKMRFLDHIYDDQTVQELTVKIVLPETVSDVEFVPPFPVEEQPREIIKTYLDTVGRTVLIFKAHNLVTEHILDFTLNYRFNMLYMLREPLMLVTAFCAIFAFVLVYVRLDFSIFRDEKAELRLRAQAIVDEAQDIHGERSNIYQSYEDLINRYKAHKDVSQFTNERRKLEVEHKNLNHSMARVQGKLGELYADGVERLKELGTLDSSYRDLVQESAHLAERLIGGKLNKQQYQSSDGDLSSKKADLIGRMDSIMENL